MLLAIGFEGSSTVWDLAGSQRGPSLPEQDERIRDAVFSPDHKWFATQIFAGAVIIHNLSAPVLHSVQAAHPGQHGDLPWVRADSGSLAIGQADGRVALWM